MRRHLIGILSIALLAFAAILWLFQPTIDGMMLQLEAACWRIGACLAVLWLAYPDLLNIPRWFWLTMPVLLIIIAKWPRIFLLLIPLLILFAIFRPRLSSRSTSNRG
jgi:hypothetical protein